jgi:hypothetical protein
MARPKQDGERVKRSISLPREIVERVQASAKREHRTLSAQLLVLLESEFARQDTVQPQSA